MILLKLCLYTPGVSAESAHRCAKFSHRRVLLRWRQVVAFVLARALALFKFL